MNKRLGVVGIVLVTIAVLLIASSLMQCQDVWYATAEQCPVAYYGFSTFIVLTLGLTVVAIGISWSPVDN